MIPVKLTVLKLTEKGQLTSQILMGLLLMTVGSGGFYNRESDLL